MVSMVHSPTHARAPMSIKKKSTARRRFARSLEIQQIRQTNKTPIKICVCIIMLVLGGGVGLEVWKLCGVILRFIWDDYEVCHGKWYPFIIPNYCDKKHQLICLCIFLKKMHTEQWCRFVLKTINRSHIVTFGQFVGTTNWSWFLRRRGSRLQAASSRCGFWKCTLSWGQTMKTNIVFDCVAWFSQFLHNANDVWWFFWQHY